MSDDDEDNLCVYGTPLKPLDEDEPVPKKPIMVEDQIATDVNGRRRFHGAFTGGFSAGFWNTVGSLEGWKPQAFKSSRGERADEFKTQRPQDFMDDEDLGEFGIAPQRIQTKEDFASTAESASTRKRTFDQSTGPIPGPSALQTLLEPAKENAGIKLLKKMGWKPGQGAGARLSKIEKRKAKKRNRKELDAMKVYGCDMGPMNKSLENDDENEDDEDVCEESSSEDDDDITFAPDDFEVLGFGIKDNRFGLGYKGLDRTNVLAQSFSLFAPLEVVDKNNKKLSIRGQAFGVGAFEAEDDDIYAREDMTRYDFSLEDRRKNKQDLPKKRVSVNCLDGFLELKATKSKKRIYTIDLSVSFKPRNWLVKRTRFAPIDSDISKKLAAEKSAERNLLNAEARRNILEESTVVKPPKIPDVPIVEAPVKSSKPSFIDALFANDKFTSGKILDATVPEGLTSSKDFIKIDEIEKAPDKTDVTKNPGLISKTVPSEAIAGSLKPIGFKPFISNPEKQDRYEKFLESRTINETAIKEFLNKIQPLNLSEFDRQMECKEFVQARKMYHSSTKGMWEERFVSEANLEKAADVDKPSRTFIKITRTECQWKPASVLCRRFNVPEPYGGTLKETKRAKMANFSVFDFLDSGINTKSNFVAPVIIPKHIERDVPTKDERQLSVKLAEEKRLLDQKDNKESNLKSSLEVSEKVVQVNNPFRDKTVVPHTSSVESIPQSVMQTTTIAAKPLGEFELKVHNSKNLHPSEKRDIFKAIFEDDSDEEENRKDDDKKSSNESTEKLLPDILGLTKTASEINVLRNTSPPRGIFSALLSSNIEKKQPKLIIKKTEDPKSVADEGLYGPKLPDKIIFSKPSSSKSSFMEEPKEKELKISKKIKLVEEWVEKDEVKKKKDKNKDRNKDKDRDDKSREKSKEKSKKHKKDKKKSKKRDR